MLYKKSIEELISDCLQYNIELTISPVKNTMELEIKGKNLLSNKETKVIISEKTIFFTDRRNKIDVFERAFHQAITPLIKFTNKPNFY